MSRKDEFKKENPNPATKFIEWKSDKKAFSYWDKEKVENVIINLPVKFLVMKELHTIKGWDAESESGIYSNEVSFIGQTELNVRSFKGGEIAKGLWNNIKEKVDAKGGYYVKSIYAMLESGELVNFQLKGGAVSEWYNFTAKTRSRLGDEWVEVIDCEERKNGGIKYYVPTFQFNTSISDSENEKAEEVYANLKLYMDVYLSAKEIKDVDVVSEDVFYPSYSEKEDLELEDDLPF